MEKLNNPNSQKDEFNVFRVTLCGITGAGKSALGNALSGQSELFKESTELTAGTSLACQKLVKWFGQKEEASFFLVDTCGFGDPAGGDEINIRDMVKKLRLLSYVNRFLLVFNSQGLKFDKQTQEMVSAFETVFGKDVFKNFSIVFTRWGYDAKSIKDRKKKNLSRESLTLSINDELKKMGFETDKFPVPCFFVDSSDFLDEEQKSDELTQEFLMLKESCMNSEKFYCIPKEEYKSAEIIFREENAKTEATRKERDFLMEKLKNQNNQKMKTMIEQINKKEIQKRKEGMESIEKMLNLYFESREHLGISLINDIRQIMEKFNEKDHLRLSKSNFEKALVDELNSKLTQKVFERFQNILETEILKFADEYNQMLNSFLPVGDVLKFLNISGLTTNAIVSGSILSLGSLGLLVAGGIGIWGTAAAVNVLILNTGRIVATSFLGPLALAGGALLGVMATGVWLLGWSREEVIKKLALAARDNVAKSQLRDILRNIAEKSLNIAADEISKAFFQEIFRGSN